MDSDIPELPEEIIIFFILTKLPTKSISRFRSVCKSWNSSTSEPSFLLLHRKLHTISNTHILISSWDKKSSKQHFLSSSPINGRSITHLLSLPLPHFLSVITVNGLLCFHYPNHCFSDRFDFPVFVFNPSTKQTVSLPHNDNVSFFEKVKVLYYFGYDFSCDEFKVLQICRFIDTNLEMSENSLVFYVLDLGSLKWRQIKPILPSFCYSYGALFSSSCASNGAIHWVIHRKKSILTFNLRDEEFCLIPFPHRFYDDKVHVDEEHLIQVRTCLALLVKTKEEIEMWVLEDYKKQEWVKERRFHYDMSDCLSTSRIPLPLGTLNEGDEEIILFKPIGKNIEDLEELFFCDMKRWRFRRAKIGGFSQWLSSNDVRDYHFYVFNLGLI